MKKQKLYKLTDAHRKQLQPWSDKWIANALRTDTMSVEERGQAQIAIAGLYATAKLDQPVNIVFTQGPVTGGIAAAIAAGVWWLRTHPEQHVGLFGRLLDEQALMGAIAPACAYACRVGFEQLWAIDAATSAATHAATSAATRDVTHAATSAATHAATSAATHAATSAATHAATHAATDAVIRFLVQCTQYAWRLMQGGNQWSGWAAYISFLRHVAKLPIDYSLWQHWERLCEISGPRYVHEKFAIVCDRNARIRRDPGCRPHCEDGPAIAWRDGVSLYYWHGTRVPRHWIEHRAELDPQSALTHENIEMRRCAAEIIGWQKVLQHLDAVVIDADADPQIGVLLQADLTDAPRSRFLQVRCGTGRTFVLPVPSEMRTALEANAWTFGLRSEEYKLEVRT